MKNTHDKYSAKCIYCKRVMTEKNEIPVWTLEPRKAQCQSCHSKTYWLTESYKQEIGVPSAWDKIEAESKSK